MESKKQRFKVLCPVEGKNDKTYWRPMGVAFPNRDGSTNVYLDGLPLNGKLQIREWDDEDSKPDRASSSQDGLPF